MPGLRDGVTRLGSWCVFLRTRSERRLLPSISPSLLRDGVTLWVECGFPPTLSKRSLLWIAGRYSFRMGSPFSGQFLPICYSIEGIYTVGLLGAFFRPVLRVYFCHPGGRPVGSEVGGVPHSVVFTSGVDCVCIPLANEGVGLGPSPSGPVASRPPLTGSVCFGGLAEFLFTRAFFMRGYSAPDGLLAPLPEVSLLSTGC